MLSCHEVTRLVAGEHLAARSFGTRLRVWLHALACRHCRRYIRQLHAIGEMARRLAREAPSPATLAPLAARICSAIAAAHPSPSEETS